jgi:hypothetical protein
MEYDYKKAEKKKEELTELTKSILLKHGKEIGFIGNHSEAYSVALIFTDECMRITPPEKDITRLELITMQPGGRGGGKSAKGGNIFINIHKLITAIAGGVLTVSGAIAVPWTLPFAAIIIWDSIYSGTNINLTELEAAVLWSLWKNRDPTRCVSNNGLLDLVNTELAAYGRKLMSQEELSNVLSNLVRIKSIQKYKKDPTKWRLCEWIRVGYK